MHPFGKLFLHPTFTHVKYFYVDCISEKGVLFIDDSENVLLVFICGHTIAYKQDYFIYNKSRFVEYFCKLLTVQTCVMIRSDQLVHVSSACST